MIKKALFTFLLTLQFAHAGNRDACSGALVKHLKEAIEHNKHFESIYYKMADNSDDIKSISYSLINMERVGILFLSSLDRKAKVYQEKNIPVMCENVVPMDGARSTTELLPVEMRPTQFHNLDIKVISKKIAKYVDEEKYEEAYQYIAEELEELEKYPEQLCLTRHFLESMARTIKLIPIQKQSAIENGLEDPTILAKKFLILQRRPLNFNYGLDKKAFKFQKEGISILCNDIPSIPWK